ncbi:hypothetical protein H4S07_001417 [Coemansia furcata]|uniref:Uncharacterized protein n=1 Tax=Coemansia furcata TaxID=417177 RepID=A0ACC1LPG4_9FUNG|nr:hypothetical protein H4S07_001417 [Coemansia furcata]
MLGPMADAWFGCTAAQWVEETRRASERFHGPQETQWIECVAELMCLIGLGLCGGAVGRYREVALRRDTAPQARRGGRQQYVVTRLCANNDDRPPITIVEMWRQVVNKAQSAAGIGDCGSESDSWDIATVLAARPSMELVPEQVPPPEHTSVPSAIDHSWSSTWDAEPALQPLFRHASTPKSSQNATQTESDVINALLDQYPELAHSLPPLSALSPAVNTNSQPFSWSHWEESYRDDIRYNQLADSQADNDERVATPAVASYARRAVYDATPPDTLMRLLEATPESVARENRAAEANFVSSRRILELGCVPRILAPATPAIPTPRLVLRSPSAIAGAREFVPETPIIQRAYSLDSIVECVPETPLRAPASRRRAPPPLSIACELPPPAAKLPEKKKRKYASKRKAVSASKVLPLTLSKSE